jgi:pyridoxine 5-phosphate synthase
VIPAFSAVNCFFQVDFLRAIVSVANKFNGYFGGEMIESKHELSCSGGAAELTRLSVNIDHIATIRQARKGSEPDPVAAALLAELAGAEGVIAHLREDRRHIQDRDLRLLRETVQTKLNLEMAATDEMQRIALEVKPNITTLVPEKREELTTEGGLEVASRTDFMRSFISRLQQGGVVVSLFIDPDEKQIAAARKSGADWVEIHTGAYANANTEKDREREFVKISEAAKLAGSLGLRVGAGHGLNYTNVRKIARIPEVEELNIGHSIISRAALVGLERAVREMRALIGN